MKQIILSLIMIASIAAEKMNITCSTYSACGTQYSYVYSQGSTNYSVSYCSNSLGPCSFDTIQLHIFSCEKDYANQTCSSKTCFLPVGVNFCSANIVPGCSGEKTGASVKCGSCSTGSSCSTGKCLMIENNTQICYPSKECAFDQIKVDYGKCTNGQDFLKNDCTCCARFCISQPIGECSSGYEFDNEALKLFAVDLENTSCFETRIQNIIALLVLAIAILMM